MKRWLWKLYFWFIVLQFIVILRASYFNGFMLVDIFFIPITGIGLIGLEAYVYQLEYFSKTFWCVFFVIFFATNIMWFSYVGYQTRNILHDQDIGMMYSLLLIVVIFLALPQLFALFRYGYSK